jgi:hypothetical protein
MQNRPNRCVFAMTDFSATTSLTHSASCKTSYSCLRCDLPQKCSTWNILGENGLVNVPRGTLVGSSLGTIGEQTQNSVPRGTLFLFLWGDLAWGSSTKLCAIGVRDPTFASLCLTPATTTDQMWPCSWRCRPLVTSVVPPLVAALS